MRRRARMGDERAGALDRRFHDASSPCTHRSEDASLRAPKDVRSL